MEIDMQELNKIDPLKRIVEKELNSEEHTPFDPPEAYAPPAVGGIPFEEMHPAIQLLMKEHQELLKVTDAFDKAISSYRESGYMMNPDINKAFGEFYKFFDAHLLLHNAKEEKHFFPVLREKLMNAGEHSVGENPTTAIEIMEDDHQRFVQLGALSFNLYGLATRIMDPASRALILDTASDNARELTELLKLHIFREDYTLFPLAQKLMNNDELSVSELAMKKMK
jgi:hemerythrin-like domain-containing protein